MAGENATLTVEGYGSKRVKVIQVGHGMSVVSSADQTKHDQSFYAVKRTSGSFGITLIFTRYREYEAFISWVKAYTRSLADGEVLAPMTVSVPSRNFTKVGVPKGTLEFGRDRYDVTWKLVLAFEGSRDPLDFDSPLVSQFKLDQMGEANEVAYYLPAMTPTEGKTGEQALYDELLDPLRSGLPLTPDWQNG